MYSSLNETLPFTRNLKKFSRLFPETREFWEKLAAEEENHISILIVGREFHRDKKLMDDFERPPLSEMAKLLLSQTQ